MISVDTTALKEVLSLLVPFAADVQKEYPSGLRVVMQAYSGTGLTLIGAQTKPSTQGTTKEPEEVFLMWLSLRIPATGQSGGTAGLDLPMLRRIAKLVSRPKAGPTTIEVKADGAVHVSTGGKKVALSGTPNPELPKFATPGQSFALPASAIHDVMEAALPMVSSDTTREHLHSLQLAFGDAKITAVSTDGHRLTLAQVPTRPHAEPFTKLLLAPLAEAILKTLKLCIHRDVRLSVGVPAATASIGDPAALLFEATTPGGVAVHAFATPRDLQYPPYERILPSPDPGDTVLPVRRDAAMPVVKQIEAIHRAGASRSMGVTLSSPLAGEPSISAISPYGGYTVYGPLPALSRSGQGHISFNISYLVEALEACDSDVATIRFRQELDPFTITGRRKGATVTAVVMPMRNGEPLPAGQGVGGNVYVSAGEAQDAMSFMLSVVNSKSAMPVLANVRIETVSPVGSARPRLRVSGTDLYCFAITEFAVENPRTDLRWASLVPAAFFNKILRTMGRDTKVALGSESLPTDEGESKVSILDLDTKVSVVLSGLGAGNFPPVPNEYWNSESIVSCAALSPALASVFPSVSDDFTRPHLSSAWLETSDSADRLLTIFGTDGHRLSVATLLLSEVKSPWKIDIAMPREAMMAARSMLKGDFASPRVAKLRISDVPPTPDMFGMAEIDCPARWETDSSRKLVFRLPDLRQSKPPIISVLAWTSERTDGVIAVDRAKLAEAAGYVGEYGGIEDKRAELVLTNTQEKATSVTVPASIEGRIGGGFNLHYVRDLAQSLSDDVVRLHVLLPHKDNEGSQLWCQGHNGPYVGVSQFLMGMGPKAWPVPLATAQKVQTKIVDNKPELAPLSGLATKRPKQAKKAPAKRVSSKRPTPVRAASPKRPTPVRAPSPKPVSAKRPTPVRAASPKRPTPVRAPSQRRPSGPHLYITDPAAFEKLVRVEGAIWEKRQHEGDINLDNGFFLNLAAFRILSEMGLVELGQPLADLDPTAGAIRGFAGSVYGVMPDGEIMLDGSSVSKGKRAEAAKHMRIV